MAESQQVKGFLSNALAKGMSKTELRNTLLKGGWPREMVDSYLQKAVPVEPMVRSVVLQCKALRKKGVKGMILDGVDLEIGKGEIFGIVGGSGSGKSTLMQIMAGLTTPDAGDVVLMVDGVARSVVRDEAARMLIGFSPQVPSVYDDMTLRENIMHFAALYGLSEGQQRSAASSLLRLAHLDTDAERLAGSLSIGQRKRLDMACALVHSPRVLLLDDPAGELDPVQQRELWAFLEDISNKGTTIVIASNFLADLETICMRIGILRNCRIGEVGKPDDLRVIYSHDFEIRVRTERSDYPRLMAVLAADERSAVKKMSKEGNMLLLLTPDPQRSLQSLLTAVGQMDDALVSIQVGRPTIQEVFEALSSR